MFQHVSGSPERFVKERLGIYAEAYLLRLVEILNADFPKLRVLMGKSKFEKMAHDYLAAYPSQYFSVRYLGSHLSKFLSNTTPYRDQPRLKCHGSV